MAWRGWVAFGFSWAVAGSFGMACSGAEEAPAGDDAGLSSGSARTPGGGAKPGNTIEDPNGTSSGGQKRPPGSSSSSGGAEDGGESSSSGGSTSSSSGNPACDDPNDTDDPNFDLTPFTVGGATVFKDGVLDGPGDVDEYSFETTGNYPSPNLFFVDPGPGARVCFYATCIEGDAAVTCGDGMTPGSDKYGQPGCCGSEGTATSQSRVEGSVTCGASVTSDHVYFYIDVKSQAAQCKPYRLRIAF